MRPAVEAKKQIVLKQLKEIKETAEVQNPKVTCQCGFCLPVRFAYRCLYCNEWFCNVCAEEHFGQTVVEKDKQRGFSYFGRRERRQAMNCAEKNCGYLGGWGGTWLCKHPHINLLNGKSVSNDYIPCWCPILKRANMLNSIATISATA